MYFTKALLIHDRAASNDSQTGFSYFINLPSYKVAPMTEFDPDNVTLFMQISLRF